ncbi:hypothetical protein AWC38_SpisGene1310 [Stylophora pistillata]|uniref:DUF6570 domain-containing protein n=1 Tax=Stylophora pistillata TaxID=50429 RepID=A0A2B4SZ68_STYPI|nr:hypothetical protein AWC38_SpisGene1310 [Stylophora pistillata]
MKNRTHYVLYQSQDAKNIENTPIIKNVETVESPGSNPGCFELNNDDVQNVEFDPEIQNEEPRTFASKQENLGSSNCKSNAFNNKTMQSSITFSQANTVDYKACSFTEEKVEGAVKNPLLNNREHFLLGFYNILDMDNTKCNSEKAEIANDLVDNQDFLHDKAMPFDVKMNDTLHEQKVPEEMIKKFHKFMQYCIYQCTVCHEAWPLRTQPKQPYNYACSRCSRDKSVPKKFSQENSMILSLVPNELEGLTQFEEILIARAFPVMHVYTKPRARRQKVADALYWLTGTNENGEPNNHSYQNITIDNERLKALPENNTLSTIPKIDLAENTDSDKDQVNIDVGPVDPDDNERVYNGESEMSSFLPTNLNGKKEKDIIDENFLDRTI